MTTSRISPASPVSSASSVSPVSSVDVTKKEQAEPKRRFSLRIRVAILAAACVAGVVAMAALGAYWTVRDNLYQQVDNNLVARAQAAVRTPPVQSQLEQIPGAFLTSSDLLIGVLSADGFITVPKQGSAPSISKDELAVAQGTKDSSIRTDLGSDTRVIALPSGAGQAMVLAQSLHSTKQTLNELSVVLFLIGGAGIIVAALAGAVVARGGLRPVERLTTATEHIARTGHLEPIPVSGDDELARLTHSFNAMLAAVSESQERQKQLVADAGHELRTPLTSLRTNLELLLSADRAGAPQLSEKDRAEIQVDIKAQLDELTQLIGDLVELARQDESKQIHEQIDLVEIVERALDRARRRAGEIQFEVSLQPWSLVGDSNALERAVLNLLDNAVKFSPEQATVSVRLFAIGDGTAVLEVEDSGPGIAAEDLSKVFDRFYRSSEARTLPGSGLGLAIVKQAAQRHGGNAYAAQGRSGGALMAIRLRGQSRIRLVLNKPT